MGSILSGTKKVCAKSTKQCDLFMNVELHVNSDLSTLEAKTDPHDMRQKLF